MSDKSVALKYFPNKSNTTVWGFYLLTCCVSLKIREIPYSMREMPSPQTLKMKGRMNY